MSGGVSPAGLGAGIAGALLVALFGGFANPQHYARLAMAAAVGGFGGALTDSLARRAGAVEAILRPLPSLDGTPRALRAATARGTRAASIGVRTTS